MTFQQLTNQLATCRWSTDDIAAGTNVAPFRIDRIRSGQATPGIIDAEDYGKLVAFVKGLPK